MEEEKEESQASPPEAQPDVPEPSGEASEPIAEAGPQAETESATGQPTSMVKTAAEEVSPLQGATGSTGAKATEAPVAAASTDVVYCVRCGGVMRRGDVFCHGCGWDSRVPPPAPPPRRVEVNPSDRSRLAALLLCLLLGWMGAHRFYAGKVGSGLLWLFTLGFLGIGVVYDLVLIGTGEFRDIDGRRMVRWE